MKRILFLMLIAFSFVGCSDEDTPKQPTMKAIDEGVPVSSDGLFCLIPDDANQTQTCYPLHGTQYNPEERQWDIPASDVKEEVDLGNGQTEIQTIREYRLSNFFPNAHNVYSLYGLGDTAFPGKDFILRFYNDKGEFVKESSPIRNLILLPAQCPWDENALIMVNTYDEVESTEDTVFFYNSSFEERKLTAPRHLSDLIRINATWHKGDDSHFLVNFTSVTIKYEQNKIYTKEFDIKSYLKKKFPNETNELSYEIRNIDVTNAIITYTLEITHDNGNKENITMKLNSKNGEVIE